MIALRTGLALGAVLLSAACSLPPPYQPAPPAVVQRQLPPEPPLPPFKADPPPRPAAMARAAPTLPTTTRVSGPDGAIARAPASSEPSSAVPLSGFRPMKAAPKPADTSS